MKVTWFRHHHENRNDLLRFGLMRLHYNMELEYVEKQFGDAKYAGFSSTILDNPDPRHLSFLLVEKGKRKIKCLVDNEDSFALITPLISEVDVCFCAGYNSDFFERRRFVNSYAWQKENDIAWYRNTIEEKIEKLGRHFLKIKRFIPIAPNQGIPAAAPIWKQKYKNFAYRLNRLTGKGADFTAVYKGFEIREGYMNDLRHYSLEYDIVLNDSLWGWPRHRLNLHTRLKEMHQRNYKIHSLLNWTDPVVHDGSSTDRLDVSLFPMQTAPIKAYEEMIAKSRLAVFACGFHWGWRNIMMLALRTGIPVLTDRLLTEPYFDMTEFKIFQQEDHEWATIEPTLNSIDHLQWYALKEHNQKVFDKYMKPEAVANYFINSLT